MNNVDLDRASGSYRAHVEALAADLEDAKASLAHADPDDLDAARLAVEQAAERLAEATSARDEIEARRTRVVGAV